MWKGCCILVHCDCWQTTLWYYCISMMRVLLYLCMYVCIFFPNSWYYTIDIPKVTFNSTLCTLFNTRLFNHLALWLLRLLLQDESFTVNRFYALCNVLSNQTSSVQLFTMRTHSDPFITKWIYFRLIRGSVKKISTPPLLCNHKTQSLWSTFRYVNHHWGKISVYIPHIDT